MRRRLLNAVFAVLLFGMPVMAQSYEYQEPPVVKERGVAKEWGIGAAFLVGCLVVAFKPAKRANLR